MRTRIMSMLTLQDSMNTKVHPDWRSQGYEWYRAIWVECAELMDHYGWKWWKKQQPDLAQVHLELIDIWHFGLSDLLLRHENAEQLTDVLAVALRETYLAQDFRQTLELFVQQTLTQRVFDVTAFGHVMASANLSFEMLYRGYIGKNVLNFFRQDHGYQDGSYRKVWQGREDNEHLAEIMQSLDDADPQLQQTIYDKLKARYATA